MGEVATGPGWELRLGRWQDVLRDVTCGSIITDPPYSARTHAGQRSLAVADRKEDEVKTGRTTTGGGINKINYEALDGNDLPDAPGWVVVFSDHKGSYQWEQYLEGKGRYVFAPVVWVKNNPTPRLAGDGPSSGVEYIVASRRREVVRCGSLPPWYQGNNASAEPGEQMMGRKPLWLMRAIVRDYSRPGDLVCDPYAGSGTTLLAAVIEGRRAIGAEMDRGRFDMAVRRLREGHTVNMFHDEVSDGIHD